MKSEDYKKLIIKDGMTGWYYSQSGDKRVVICDVEKSSSGVVFSLLDSKSKKIIKHNGIVLKFSAELVITKGIVVIDDPIFLQEDNVNVATVNIDINKEQRDSLRSFFQNQIKLDDEPFRMDDEQLDAIMCEKNTLVTARAGSGKTRVLVAKAIDLFENKGLKETDVLAFCFNHDASVEISDRLNSRCLVNEKYKYLNYDIAKTFHSFAKKICPPQSILVEEKTKLIKAIINHNRKTNKKFSNKVYQFFRNETLRIDRKRFESMDDYYRYIKNSEYITLNGEKVKSKQEKYIADYLFEHNIEYIYEKSFYPYKIDLFKSKLSAIEFNEWSKFLEEKKETKPDFYIQERNIVWEHWAVNGNESEDEIKAFNKGVGSYDEYVKNKNWKLKFWDKSWIKKLNSENRYNNELKNVNGFIQTYSRELKNLSRDDFENYIENLLRKYSIYNKKLSENIIIEKVWEKGIDAFTQLIEQFINKLQQNFYDDMESFRRKIENISDIRTKAFCELGLEVYEQYCGILKNPNNPGDFKLYNRYSTDFNQLIYQASKIIKNGEEDGYISKLKWILIDEYQDFSKLFNDLIDSILSRNPNVKLFCVGDDWQAINRFAGSNLYYFKSFAERYKESRLMNIRTNYRSDGAIVNFANTFMTKCGISGERPIAKRVGRGETKELDISNLYVGKNDDDNIYLKYFEEREKNKFDKARYLKACSDIIKENSDKKIMVLNRSNQILLKELEDFERVLRRVCENFISKEVYEENVRVKTVHKSKGEEADIVILLNINENVFPVSNCNNCLFEVFGEDLQDSYEDEQRLYYVALTRAKQSLYILYDKPCKSEFIMY